MEERQLHALLISGDEFRFALDVMIFRDYLLKELHFDSRRMQIAYGSFGNHYIFEQTKLFFDRVKREDRNAGVIIFYSGHGIEGGFGYNQISLPYTIFGRLINHDGNFIFVNSSCYSESAKNSNQ